MSEAEFVLIRTGRSHCELDASDTDAHQGTKLQQLEPDRIGTGSRHFGVLQSDPAQRSIRTSAASGTTLRWY